jgi:hypothetical protein
MGNLLLKLLALACLGLIRAEKEEAREPMGELSIPDIVTHVQAAQTEPCSEDQMSDAQSPV